jgi:hypothetical protein
MSVKTKQELREKLKALLSMDCRKAHDPRIVYSKIAACKTLLWALGENDDDRWFITSMPGPAIDSRAKARN